MQPITTLTELQERSLEPASKTGSRYTPAFKKAVVAYTKNNVHNYDELASILGVSRSTIIRMLGKDISPINDSTDKILAEITALQVRAANLPMHAVLTYELRLEG